MGQHVHLRVPAGAHARRRTQCTSRMESGQASRTFSRDCSLRDPCTCFSSSHDWLPAVARRTTSLDVSGLQAASLLWPWDTERQGCVRVSISLPISAAAARRQLSRTILTKKTVYCIFPHLLVEFHFELHLMQ